MEENSITTSKHKESDFIKVQVQSRNHSLLDWPRLAQEPPLRETGTAQVRHHSSGLLYFRHKAGGWAYFSG